jgi:hypothetical protein
MNSPRYLLTHRAIARGIRIVALAGCLLAGAGIVRPIPHAAAGPLPFCTTHHYLTGASAHYSVLRVHGLCFPYPSSAHIAIRDLTTGTVLKGWTSIPVTLIVPSNPPIPGFRYVTQGDARPGDAIRFYIADGAWHRILTVSDTP